MFRIVTLNANGIRSAGSKGLFSWLTRVGFLHAFEQDRIGDHESATKGYTLLNADEKTAEKMLEMLVLKATNRLIVESQLSKKAIAAGGSAEEEQKILDAWLDYYQKSLDTVKDLVPKADEEFLKKIIKAKILLVTHTKNSSNLPDN